MLGMEPWSSARAAVLLAFEPSLQPLIVISGISITCQASFWVLWTLEDWNGRAA